VKDIVRPGETISSTSLSRRAGGKGANQAVAVAKAGGNVTLIGAIGQDGAWVKDQLKSFGVEVEGIKTDQESTGRAIIQLAKSGENSIILYKGANYASFPMPTISGLAPYSHLLLQNEIPFPITLSYLSLSKSPTLKANITTVYNPSPMLTPAQILNEMKWELINWLVVNEGEAQQILDVLPTSAFASHPTNSLQGNASDSVLRSCKLISRLASHPSFKSINIVCTLGPLGVLACLTSAITDGDTQIIHELGVPITEVRDTTGAGDCWTGYLVAGLMELQVMTSPSSTSLDVEDIRQLLRRCNQAAGMCVEKNGAMESIPGKDEIAAWKQERKY